MKKLRIGIGVIAALFICFLFYEGFQWTICRVYVPEGHSLMLRWKGPLVFRAGIKFATPGHFAQDGEIGVLSDLHGPGRHFYNPIYYERKIIKDTVIEPGNVGICTSKLGNDLPKGEFLVDGDLNTTQHKGILRKCFGPGRYRVHPYAYEMKIIQTQQDQVGREGATQIKHSGWVDIPAGYVGVVTYLTNDKAANIVAGTSDKVLPPGLYPVNPREAQVDIVEIGFRETSIAAEKMTDAQGEIVKDESGEAQPVPGTGINFPSNDGRKIAMDFTGIWGVMPNQAPDVVRTFGNVSAVEQKVIIPQCESICRNNGSRLDATELLEGTTRTAFQERTTKEFKLVLEGGTLHDEVEVKQEDGTVKKETREREIPGKNLTLLYALVRHIYIPQDIRTPIQQGYIAEELKLTRSIEKETAKIEANLREAEQTVMLEGDKVKEDTKKQVAAVEREGTKQAKEIDADTERQVAAIQAQVAAIEAEIRTTLGEAEAQAEQMKKEATADLFKQAVAAFGDASSYTKWQFAENLPEDIELQLLYAGEGTLWTDLKNGAVPTIPVKAAPKATGE